MRDFSELADLYERLCQKMRSVNVRVLTANKELCSVGYGELLVPGTVVQVEGRKYFYCGERNANELESSWGFFVPGCSPPPIAAVFPVARRWRASFCLLLRW